MDKSHFEIWQNCLEMIREHISPASFKTWFEPIVPMKLTENVLTIQVPSPFFYEYLEDKFIDILRRTLVKQLGKEAKLKYSIVVPKNNFTNHKPAPKQHQEPKKNINAQQGTLPYVSDNEIKNPFVIPGIKKVHIDSQLNPVYTFENFVEGECNRLARSAALAVASNPGSTAYNPLMLYGDAGLGKTHLAQAVGLEIKSRYREFQNEKVVLYVSANKFQTQFVEATRNNTVNDFLNFYQMIDVLIIDDVQEFAGKEKTQNTFFHIFNHLHQQKKQLILTSDRPPVELKGLEQRLLSRFKWGLSTDLQIPEYRTRLAILTQKMKKEGASIPQDVLEFIATNVRASVRELEGALISLLAHSTLSRRQITVELAKQVITNLVPTTKVELTLSKIQAIVAEYFNVNVDDLVSKTRKREIVQARQIAMFLAKDMTNASLSEIGAEIGRKDHSTVLHAYKTVSNLVITDVSFRRYIDEITVRLKSI